MTSKHQTKQPKPLTHATKTKTKNKTKPTHAHNPTQIRTDTTRDHSQKAEKV